MWSIDWSLPWSTYSSYRKSESICRYKSKEKWICLKYIEFVRIHQRIGKVINLVKVYNVYMEYHFLIQNNLKNGNFFKKKQLNEIIERLVLNKISSSFMKWVLVHVSFIQKEHIFITNLSNFFEYVKSFVRNYFQFVFLNRVNIVNVVIKKWFHRIFTIQNYGKHQAIGIIIPYEQNFLNF